MDDRIDEDCACARSLLFRSPRLPFLSNLMLVHADFNEARRGRSERDRPGWHAVCKLLDSAASDPFARVAPQALAAAARMDDALSACCHWLDG